MHSVPTAPPEGVNRLLRAGLFMLGDREGWGVVCEVGTLAFTELRRV